MKTLCLFCGASTGKDSEFLKKGSELGKYLADNKIHLVYGGSNCGLMGIVANSSLANNGKVTAVITRALKQICGHENNSKLIITESLSERKQKMIEMSDAFMVLPGGFGTLDEAFEVLTELQLQHHQKPLGFLNINGYFDCLFGFMDRACEAGFVSPSHRKLVISSNDINQLASLLLT